MEILISVCLAILILSVILSFVRFIKGPAVSDRVLSLDIITIMITTILVFLSLFFERSIYLDVALIFGVISFIGVVIVGRYLERGV